MLFSFAVRSVYMESCSMFVRGGVYIVVKDSMGPFVARLSVSSLVFDYILTGPISVVSAGQYLGHLLDEIAKMLGQSFPFNVNYFAAFFAVIVTVYFWWQNTKGMHESSGKALRIMQITTVMVVALLIWCPLTIFLRGHITLPPAPFPRNLQFGDESLGWFKGTIFPTIPIIALMIAIGHSLLSMSGFETLAQVYREIAYPKMKNLKITGNIVCWYAVVCTGVITLFACMIISPADIRKPLFGQSAGRPGDAFGRTRVAQARVSYFCRHRGRADSFGRREHVHHRRQRRSESRGRGRRAAGLVPQTAQTFRHHLPHRQHDCAAADSPPSSSAAAMFTCWAKRTRLAWCGVSS